MSRRDRQRLDDVRAALDAIDDHVRRGDLTDGLVFDAVRVRLIEIGEPSSSCPPRRVGWAATGAQLLGWQRPRVGDAVAHPASEDVVVGDRLGVYV